MVWTADDLLSSVKRRAQLPSAGGKLSDSGILEIADEETRTTVAEVLREAREELGVHWTDISLSDGQRDYRIPERAQGANLREIKLLDSDGEFYDVPNVGLTEVDYYRDGAAPWWRDGVACAVVGDLIRVAPDPSSSNYTLRVYYYRRPSRLALTTSTDVAPITTVNSSTSWDFDNTTGFSSALSAGDKVDLVQGRPNFDALIDDGVIDTINASDLTLSSGSSDEAAVGDYLCQPGVTPVPQIPVEVHPFLLRATLVSVLEAIGDRRGAALAQRKLEETRRSVVAIINERVEGAPQKLVNRNSPLRSQMRPQGWS